MSERVINFLYKIGFTDDDIEEFYEEEADIVAADGTEYRGPDCLYVEVIEDTKSADIRNSGETMESYWEKGWISDFCFVRRHNFDSIDGRYYKVFPTRYRLDEFKLTKSLRRVLRRNADLRSTIRPLRITPAKSDLHDAFNFLRHGRMPEKPLTKIYEYIKYYPTDLTELCVFKDEKLVACSIFEVGEYAAYSNTAFWDLNEKARGLGTLTVLLEAEYARGRGLRHYYLGFFNPHNPNYHYKTRFGGLELYDWDNDGWVNFKSVGVKDLLKQKLPRHKD